MVNRSKWLLREREGGTDFWTLTLWVESGSFTFVMVSFTSKNDGVASLNKFSCSQILNLWLMKTFWLFWQHRSSWLIISDFFRCQQTTELRSGPTVGAYLWHGLWDRLKHTILVLILYWPLEERRPVSTAAAWLPMSDVTVIVWSWHWSRWFMRLSKSCAL